MAVADHCLWLFVTGGQWHPHGICLRGLCQSSFSIRLDKMHKSSRKSPTETALRGLVTVIKCSIRPPLETTRPNQLMWSGVRWGCHGNNPAEPLHTWLRVRVQYCSTAIKRSCSSPLLRKTEIPVSVVKASFTFIWRRACETISAMMQRWSLRRSVPRNSSRRWKECTLFFKIQRTFHPPLG